MHNNGYDRQPSIPTISLSVDRYSGRIFGFVSNTKSKVAKPSTLLHWFGSVFPKKVWTLCKTDPVLSWIAWLGFGQTCLVQKQAGVQESLGPVSDRMQPACYKFPTFRFWPNGSGPEVSWCARIIRPCFWADLDEIWMFTGKALPCWTTDWKTAGQFVWLCYQVCV